jgi:hypothetical protein
LAFIAISGALLGHDPEKWKPVFGQDHAPANTWWFAAESREFGAGSAIRAQRTDKLLTKPPIRSCKWQNLLFF